MADKELTFGDKATAIGLIAVGFVASLIGVILLNAAVLGQLWRWFVVPIFSAAEIGYAGAVGLSILASYLTVAINLKKDDRTLSQIVGGILLRPAVAFVVGWIAHFWM